MCRNQHVEAEHSNITQRNSYWLLVARWTSASFSLELCHFELSGRILAFSFCLVPLLWSCNVHSMLCSRCKRSHCCKRDIRVGVPSRSAKHCLPTYVADPNGLNVAAYYYCSITLQLHLVPLLACLILTKHVRYRRWWAVRTRLEILHGQEMIKQLA